MNPAGAVVETQPLVSQPPLQAAWVTVEVPAYSPSMAEAISVSVAAIRSRGATPRLFAISQSA